MEMKRISAYGWNERFMHSDTSDTSSLPMHSLCMIIEVARASFALKDEQTVPSIFH